MTTEEKIEKKTNRKQAVTIIHDDNPKDLDVVGQEKTDPNSTMRAEEILHANNFLGDL